MVVAASRGNPDAAVAVAAVTPAEAAGMLVVADTAEAVTAKR